MHPFNGNFPEEQGPELLWNAKQKCLLVRDLLGLVTPKKKKNPHPPLHSRFLSIQEKSFGPQWTPWYWKYMVWPTLRLASKPGTLRGGLGLPLWLWQQPPTVAPITRNGSQINSHIPAGQVSETHLHARFETVSVPAPRFIVFRLSGLKQSQLASCAEEAKLRKCK